MQILDKQPSTKGPEHMFTGDVWFDIIAKGDEPSRVRVNTVRFAPGARTAWHSHAVGQTLYVTEGIGLVQARGGEIREMHPGEAIWTPPCEWHWHGAAPGHFMTHVAIWEAPESGAESNWGNLVTDDEYSAAGKAAGDATASGGSKRSTVSRCTVGSGSAAQAPGELAGEQSPQTRNGYAKAKSMAMAPPSECPASTTRSTASSSSTQRKPAGGCAQSFARSRNRLKPWWISPATFVVSGRRVGAAARRG